MSSLLNDSRLLIGFPDYQKPAQRLAREAGIPYSDALIHHFPDGETRLRLPAALPEQVVLCQTLNHPNSRLVELVLAAATARDLGAKHITLVAPYLCYMRQDKAFHPGEAVSQRIVGTLLSQWIDALITVDSHLHRVHRLKDAVPVDPAINLTASPVMSAFLLKQIDNPFLVGPDEESEQWVASIARDRGYDYCVARKQRLVISRCVSACQRPPIGTGTSCWSMTLPVPVARLKMPLWVWHVLNPQAFQYWSPMPCSWVKRSSGCAGRVSVTSGALILFLTPVTPYTLITCLLKH